MKPLEKKRPAPVAVRMPEKDKKLLEDAASAVGTSRNAFMKSAALSLVEELKAARLIP